MALTQLRLQALRGNTFPKFYLDHQAHWREKAENAYKYALQALPKGEHLRVDDVAAMLLPALAMDPTLRNRLQTARLPQRYWVSDFCDYILDQLFNEIDQDKPKSRRERK